MRPALLCLVLALAGCATGHEASPSSAPSVVRIPSFSATPAPSESAGLPARADPLPPPGPDDPFRYYVGKWHGLVNGSFETDLVVSDDGRFRIELVPNAKRTRCDLAGRLRVGERVIYFDVESSSCGAEPPGTTLERVVTEQSDGEFAVRSSDGMMSVRYTRKSKR